MTDVDATPYPDDQDPIDGTSLAGRADRILDPGADDVAVTRSEERLVVRTEAVPVRRVRIRKVIVSEERTVTVTVRREELRVEEEPLDGTDVVDRARSSRSARPTHSSWCCTRSRWRSSPASSPWSACAWSRTW